MSNKQFILKVLIKGCICLSLIGCTRRTNTHCNTKVTSNQKLINAILYGKHAKLATDLYCFLYGDEIYLIGKQTDMSSKNMVKTKFYQPEHIEDNLYFEARNLVPSDSLDTLFQHLWIMKKEYSLMYKKDTLIPLNIAPIFSNTRSVQDYQLKDIEMIQGYDRDLDLLFNKSFLAGYFKQILKSGIFFKTSNRFFILIKNEYVFFISNSLPSPKNTFMFHLLDSNGNFVNKDFNFAKKSFNSIKVDGLQELFVSKIHIGHFNFNAMRIGEYYRVAGVPQTIWNQTIFMEDVFSNELLRYNNELESTMDEANN